MLTNIGPNTVNNIRLYVNTGGGRGCDLGEPAWPSCACELGDVHREPDS